MAQDLLLSGADHDVRGSLGEYPLHLAARRGRGDVVLALMHKRADLDCRDESNKCTDA